MTASPLIGHYELLERIAEGGMGVVYKARDVRLERPVALKFLPHNLRASREDMARFLHEARAISRLNHPNIATIHAVEETADERFLVFEFLPGGSLRERLDELKRRGELLPLEQAVAWAIQIGRALAHAHRHGIVHRDVKTGNVLLTADDDAKLTDFGLAQIAGGEGLSDSASGTAAYMSPEQAQGLNVDRRSDVFSFGVTVFEMVTGRMPWEDTHAAALLYDIVNTPAPPLRRFRPEAPSALQAIVDRALAKDPGDRLQSMEEALDRLRRVAESLRVTTTAPPPALREPAVAVLPFVDMSPQRDQEVFCDGLAEEIILALSEIRGLRVVSRTSSFRFKGEAYDVHEIGDKLRVGAVLEGSVRKAGDQLRVTVQLVDVATGYHVFAARFDRNAADVFAIQDEIARAVAESLRAKLSRRKPRRHTPDLEAYNLYLEGRYHLNQRTRFELQKALGCFQQALARDAAFAAASAGLAETFTLMAAPASAHGGQASALAEARRAALRALELDDLLPEAHVAMALVQSRADWDWAGAERSFQRAIGLNENYAAAHHQYAMFLAALLRLEEARREIARAHELDPLSLIISTAVGRIWHFSREFDKAIEQCQRTIELNPNFAQAYFDLSIAYARLKRYDEAKEAIDAMQRLAPDPIRHALLMGYWAADTGRTEEAARWRERLLEINRDRPISPVALSILEITLGELERAMELLEQAGEERDVMLTYLQCEPTWDPIRRHPRYAALVRRIGFPALAGKSSVSALVDGASD